MLPDKGRSLGASNSTSVSEWRCWQTEDRHVCRQKLPFATGIWH